MCYIFITIIIIFVNTISSVFKSASTVFITLLVLHTPTELIHYYHYYLPVSGKLYFCILIFRPDTTLVMMCS